jgi:predicted P-loop ATPase
MIEQITIEQITISAFKSKHDAIPKRWTGAWSQFLSLFTKVRRTTCTLESCLSAGWRKATATASDKTPECPHKNGKAWSPAIYPAGSPRQKKNVQTIGLLVADLDHRPEEELTKVRGGISKYQYIIHASHSDRPANPNASCTCGSEPGALHGTSCPARVDRCVRIIFVLSRPVLRDEWPRFWRAAMRMLGLPADPSTCDANRLYYLPSRPGDADYFCATNDGVALDVEEVLASAPDDPVPAEDTQALTLAADLHIGDGGVVEPGQRHAMLKSIAGALRFRGAGEQEILVALRNANQTRCNPPKSDEELQRLAAWAIEQPTSSLPPLEPDPRRRVPDSEQQPNGPTDEDEEFARDEDGKIIPSQDNVDLALRKLGVRLRYDEFASHEIIEGLAGFGPRLDDRAVNRLRFTIDAQFGFLVPKVLFFDIVSDRASLHRFHPVRRYLDALKWDGDNRLDRWLVDYAGAKDTPYVRAVSRIVLIAAVRRVRHPGAKYDEMLILESEQGTEKSSGLRVLAVDDDWFTDDLPLGSDTKRFMEATAGKWIVEAGELKGMSRADVTSLKACLSRQIDEARMSYDRKQTIQARQFVIIGTTNETDGYLRDPTGNRRFWPVRIQRIDLGKLRRDRDQLWAEASVAEAAGESIRLDPVLYEEAALEQDARTRNEDPLVDALCRSLGNVTGKLRIADAYLAAGIEPGKATQDQMLRFGQAIRELGWERARRRIAGERCYAYVRGSETEREVELWVEVDHLTKAVKISRASHAPGSN